MAPATVRQGSRRWTGVYGYRRNSEEYYSTVRRINKQRHEHQLKRCVKTEREPTDGRARPRRPHLYEHTYPYLMSALMLRAVRLPPPTRRAALLTGGALLTAAGTYSAVASCASSSSDSVLGSLWATAIDGMLDVPGAKNVSSVDGVLYLAPLPDDKKPAPKVEWPRVFAKGVVFSLTAWNPMGEEAPPEYNEAANKRLEEDIKELRIEPRAWWHSFGFNEREGWREEGFSIAFAREERVFAREAMLKLAKRHRQAALYAYAFEEGTVVREVVWVDYRKHKELSTKERMTVLKKPPRTPLAQRRGAPPQQPQQPSGASPPEQKKPRWKIFWDRAWEPK